MSIIGVKGVPQEWSLINVVKVLAKTTSGNFEALNFQTGVKARNMKTKICYLRLSEKLDPVRVVEKINSTLFPKQFRLFAFIPDYVPDIPMTTKLQKKLRRLRSAHALKVADEDLPGGKILTITNNEILAELQTKYPELYNVSAKTNHQLLEDLGKQVLERLKVVADRNKEVTDSCFKLSQWYRRMHPHFGDFQLVLSTLHAIEDAAGTPRTQLQKTELAAVPPHPHMIDNLPLDKVQAAWNKYSERIIEKISDHVKNLKSEVTEADTEDDIVRKKVREELKKMTPFLPLIVKQVVMNNLTPRPSTSNAFPSRTNFNNRFNNKPQVNTINKFNSNAFCVRCRTNGHTLSNCSQPRTLICFKCGLKDVKFTDCPNCKKN